MSVFEFDQMTSFGKVQSVDTSTVIIHVTAAEQLSSLQVNHLIAIRSSMNGLTLIGMVNKIMRKYGEDPDDDSPEELIPSTDMVKAILIGTLLDRSGERRDVFKRTLESVPEVDSDAFLITDETLKHFMSVISGTGTKAEHPLCIGKYTINDETAAYLDGNKFFQRHAVIVGSTGSGKSYTVAKLLEEVSKLKSCNAILFDIHGEYGPIKGERIQHYKIAGPSDTVSEGIMFLPYWLLTYEEMQAMLIDRSDANAPNQAMMFSKTVLSAKKWHLGESHKDLADRITVDSPVPYLITTVLAHLNAANTEMVEGLGGRSKQGDFHGKLSRFIQRFEAKTVDKRLNFMFASDAQLLELSYMETLCRQLMAPASQGGGIKILDLSEVPSDILPLIVSLIARIIFSVQQWMDKDKINPLAIFCDEAHLYIPANTDKEVDRSSLRIFERIAKEGRKYGIGLVIVSQRPSEVNRTVLSQSSNFIAMRLTNADDQTVIRKLFPDSIGNYTDLLPVLDIGEAIAVGDASLLPSRIVIDKPTMKPDSATVKFWDKWCDEEAFDILSDAVLAMRRQGK